MIFLGILRLSLFYQFFGVNIIYYLEFSEILTSFLDYIVFTLSVLLFAIFAFFLYMNEDILEEKLAAETKIQLEPFLLKRFLLFLKKNSGFIYLFLFTLLLFGSVALVIPGYYKDLLYILGYYLVIIIFSFLVGEIFRKNESLPYAMQVSIICILLCFLSISITIFWTYSEVESIRRKKTNYGVILQLTNDQIMVSDSNNYYIGKTQNYVFFHHEIKQQTDIIPINRIKELNISTERLFMVKK